MKKYGLDSLFSPTDLSFLNISDKDALKSDWQNVANDMHKIIKFEYYANSLFSYTFYCMSNSIFWI